MRNILILAITLFTMNTIANCENDTYILNLNDYDSDMNDSCKSFIVAAMAEKGCSQIDVNENDISILSEGSSLMCVYSGNGGIYQVMASQMSEPNRAVILFSRFD